MNDNNNAPWHKSKWFFWLMVVFMPPVAIILLFAFRHYEDNKGLRTGVVAYAVIITVFAVILGAMNDPDEETANIGGVAAVNQPTEAQEPPPTQEETAEPEPTPEPETEPAMVFDTLLGNNPVIYDPQNNAEAYLALLSIVGESFADMTLTEDSYQKMHEHGIAELVTYILMYRFENNDIPAELQHSFGLFWEDNSATTYSEVHSILISTFDLNRVFSPRYGASVWELSWHGDPYMWGYAIATADHLYNGVHIYWKNDPEDPDEEAIHAWTILAWGNEGLMENRVFAVDSLGRESWEHINFFVEQIDGISPYLIRLDDPAFERAERTTRAAEADNFRHVDISGDLSNIALYQNELRVYAWNPSEGTILGLGGTVWERVSTTRVLFWDINLAASEEDVTWIFNNFVVRR